MRKRTRPQLLAALSVAGVALACQLDKKVAPAKPVIHYSLADATTAVVDGQPLVPIDVQANIKGSLDMLFGSPANPQILLLDEWKQAGFDLNWPTYAADDSGSGEFSEAELEVLWQDNAREFRRPLAAIEAGKWSLVDPPEWTPSLIEAWDELCATKPEAERDDAFKQEARALFTNFYPRLRDSAELYRQHCLHCHGPEGGGNGPTAGSREVPFLDPRPRDYRLGLFKFTSVGKSAPRRADLFRILDEGVTATAMPSFRRFAKSQLHGLVDYVRLLSMRGMVERDLVATYKNESAITQENVTESFKSVWEKWVAADAKVLAFDGPVPAPSAASIEHGKALFLDAAKGNCFSCHGADGRGDGPSAFVLDPESGELKSAYKDDWGFDIVPRNLRFGLFRGGRRPIDIFRRVKNGIAGTPMPELASTLSNDDVWALVHYVGSLAERPKAVEPASEHGGAHAPDTEKH